MVSLAVLSKLTSLKSPILFPTVIIPPEHMVSGGAPLTVCLLCSSVNDIFTCRSQTPQLNQVHMGPVSFHLLRVSPAACLRCPPHGHMMVVAVPTISAAYQAGRKGRHFLLLGLFFIMKSPVDFSLHLIGYYSVTCPCLALWESRRAIPSGLSWEAGSAIRQER